MVVSVEGVLNDKIYRDFGGTKGVVLSVVVAGREMVLYVRGQAGFGESTVAARIFKVTTLINAIAASL